MYRYVDDLSQAGQSILGLRAGGLLLHQLHDDVTHVDRVTDHLERHVRSLAREHARGLMRRLELYDKRGQVASGLTLPDRKRLEVARALATDPKFLLLDEVMAGLRPNETTRIVNTLRMYEVPSAPSGRPGMVMVSPSDLPKTLNPFICIEYAAPLR